MRDAAMIEVLIVWVTAWIFLSIVLALLVGVFIRFRKDESDD
jgi:hypothetical protein